MFPSFLWGKLLSEALWVRADVGARGSAPGGGEHPAHLGRQQQRPGSGPDTVLSAQAVAAAAGDPPSQLQRCRQPG